MRVEENVDRSSKTTKAKSLITSIESFLFEMIVNQSILRNSSFSTMASRINYFYFEIVNFVFICLHNLILLIHYDKSYTMDAASYDILDESEFTNLLANDNWILAIIQIIFLLCVIGLWYKYNFIVCYFNNLQMQYESGSNNLFKRIQKYREMYQSEKPDFYKVLNEQFDDVPLMTKIRIAIVDTLCLNGEIMIPILSLVFLLLYLIIHTPFFLVVPIIFLAHIFPTLWAVFQGVYSRFGNLFGVYIFIYLLIYIFM